MQSSERKIRVSIQLNQLGYGGTEKAVLTILKHIDLNRFHVQVILRSPGGPLKFFKYFILRFFFSHYRLMFNEKFVSPYARLDEFKRFAGGGVVIVSGWSGFRNAVERFRPDIVHFNRGLAKEFYSMKLNELRGPKFIETSIFGVCGPPVHVKQLSRVIFQSEWLLSNSALAKEVSSVRLYIPVELIRLGIGRARPSHSGGNDELTIGRLSRPSLDDGKVVANIILPLLDRNPNLVFKSMGSSDYFIRATKSHPRIIHVRPTVLERDIFDFLDSLDILLHYRLEGETFGLNIAEAMALGKPVVSHRSHIDNAQVEILTGFGEAGLIVDDPSNLGQFQEYLQALIDSRTLRDLLGRRGLSIARENFDPVLITRKLEAIYTDVILN